MSAKTYVVGATRDEKGLARQVFRNSKSGLFVTEFMSDKTFVTASGSANSAIREALKNSPTGIGTPKK